MHTCNGEEKKQNLKAYHVPRSVNLIESYISAFTAAKALSSFIAFKKKIFMQTPTCCQGANEESCGLKEHSWIILPVRLDTFTAPCAFACWASYGGWGGGTPSYPQLDVRVTRTLVPCPRTIRSRSNLVDLPEWWGICFLPRRRHIHTPAPRMRTQWAKDLVNYGSQEKLRVISLIHNDLMMKAASKRCRWYNATRCLAIAVGELTSSSFPSCDVVNVAHGSLLELFTNLGRIKRMAMDGVHCLHMEEWSWLQNMHIPIQPGSCKKLSIGAQC